MVSQRIEDALEVLALMRERWHRGAASSVRDLRITAAGHVASRGVRVNTVHAHLVGKNVAHTLPTSEFDRLARAWLQDDSSSLERWYLLDANREEAARVREFFRTDAGATPQAVDLAEPEAASRVVVTTYRILRDTALARRIKAEQQYACQLCRLALRLADGKPYAEAHHVRPLGKGHDGPDVPGNILCVCPNCHVLLDYGAIRLDPGQLPTIAPAYVDYHNEHVAKPTAHLHKRRP